VVDFNRTKTISRPQRQAMITVATALVGWVAFYQVGIQWRANASSNLDHPPVLFVDLKTASEAELQLLPEIGRKTAHAWRETLDESLPSTPLIAKELEALPNVGPIRSNKLAPFLVDSDARPANGDASSIKTNRPSANP